MIDIGLVGVCERWKRIGFEPPLRFGVGSKAKYAAGFSLVRMYFVRHTSYHQLYDTALAHSFEYPSASQTLYPLYSLPNHFLTNSKPSEPSSVPKPFPPYTAFSNSFHLSAQQSL